MEENLPTENTPQPAGGKTSRIFFVIAVVLVLVIVRNGIVLLRQAKEQKTKENISDQRVPTVVSVQPTSVEPAVSTPPLVSLPVYTPEQEILAGKATTKEVAVTEDGVAPKELTVGFHDTIIFRNVTKKEIVIEFPSWPLMKILPNDTWGRSFEEFRRYEYFITGLNNQFIGNINVVKK